MNNAPRHRTEGARIEAFVDGCQRILVGSAALAAAAGYDLITQAPADQQMTPMTLAAVVPGSIVASLARRVGAAPETTRKVTVATAAFVCAAAGVVMAHKYGFTYTAEIAGVGAATGAGGGFIATEAYAYNEPFGRLTRRAEETTDTAAPAHDTPDVDETTDSLPALSGIPPMPPGSKRRRFRLFERRKAAPPPPPLPLASPAAPVVPARAPAVRAVRPPSAGVVTPQTMPDVLSPQITRRGGLVEAIQISYADIKPQPQPVQPIMPQPQRMGPGNAAPAQMAPSVTPPPALPPEWPPRYPGV